MISGIGSSMSISSDMMLQRQEQMFSRVDQNGDAQLDESELQVMADKMSERTGMSMDAGQIMSKLDTDGDNMISEEEFAAGKPPEPPQQPTYNLTELLYQEEAENSNDCNMIGSLLDVLS